MWCFPYLAVKYIIVTNEIKAVEWLILWETQCVSQKGKA